MPFLPRRPDQRDERFEKPQHIKQINRERDELGRTEPDVTVARAKKSGIPANQKRAREIQEEKARNEENDVEALIAPNNGVEPAARFARSFAFTRMNEAEIVNEKQPDERGVKRADCKPAMGIIQAREDERLSERAADVEKIVPEFQWPADQRERVHDRARPKDQDNEQAGGGVNPKGPLREGEDRARIVDQEKERHALDNAGQRQLDSDDDGIEIATFFVHNWQS